MLQELSEIMGMQVYTPGGVYLGNVDNVVMDMDARSINGIFIRDTNPILVEGSIGINVPYRWIQAVGDVVILKHFPNRVAAPKEEIVDF